MVQKQYHLFKQIHLLDYVGPSLKAITSPSGSMFLAPKAAPMLIALDARISLRTWSVLHT